MPSPSHNRPVAAFPSDRFVSPRPSTDRSKVCFLDTETTGLEPETDEVIQLAVVLLDGTVAYKGYFKPEHTSEWHEAEKVNHISPSMLEGEPSLTSEKERIESVLSSCEIITGWNVRYDLEMLSAGGIDFPESVEFCDLMPAFCDAWRAGHPDYREGRQRERLVRATEWLGLEHDAHDALGDTTVLVPIWDWVVETLCVRTSTYAGKPEE